MKFERNLVVIRISQFLDLSKKYYLLFPFLIFQLYVSAQVKKGKTTRSNFLQITGTFKNIRPSGQINLYIWDHVLLEEKKYQEPCRKIPATIENGKFIFNIGYVKPNSYITINKGNTNQGFPIAIIDLYRIEGGDQIHLDIDGSKMYNGSFSSKFSGKGALKYQCRYILDSLYFVYQKEYNKKNILQTTNRKELVYRHVFDEVAYITDKQLQYLNFYKHLMSHELSNSLKLDLISANANHFFYPFISRSDLTSLDKETIDSIRNLYVDNDLVKRINELSIDESISSPFYTSLIVNKMASESVLLYKAEDEFNLIKNRLLGRARDKIITAYLHKKYTFVSYSDAQRMITDALSFVKTPVYKTLLKSLNNQGIGSPFYKFKLPDKNGKIFGIDDFKGKLVFIDFYYTGCTNCANFFKSTVLKAEEYFENSSDVVFVTISIDVDKDKWVKSLESGLYTSDKAINLYTAGMGINHPLIKELNLMGYPHPILIDRQGNILNNTYSELGQKDAEILIDRISKSLENDKFP